MVMNDHQVIMRPGLRQLIGCIVHCIPTFVKRAILSLARSNFDQSTRELVTGMLKYYRRLPPPSLHQHHHHHRHHHQTNVSLLASYTTIQNVLYMAYLEAYEILDLDEDLLRHDEHEVRPTLLFLYGRTDPYTPMEFHDAMKMLMPDGTIPAPTITNLVGTHTLGSHVYTIRACASGGGGGAARLCAEALEPGGPSGGPLSGGHLGASTRSGRRRRKQSVRKVSVFSDIKTSSEIAERSRRERPSRKPLQR
jgi:hypothetical protein